MDEYIAFGVAKYAIPDVLEALYLNGITNGFVTKEDDDLHVRWKYIPERSLHHKSDLCNNNCIDK